MSARAILLVLFLSFVSFAKADPDIIKKNNFPTFVAGKNTVMERKWAGYDDNYINIGSIQTSWISEMKDNIIIRMNQDLKARGLEFALPEETDLNNIQDPSQYEYYSQKNRVLIGHYLGKKFIFKEKIEPEFDALVNIDQVIILKRGYDYAAIKPIGVNSSSITSLSMDYEWRFWPAVPKSNKFIAKVKKIEWQLAQIPLSEEFVIGDVIFKWIPIDLENKIKQDKARKEGKPHIPEGDFKLNVKIVNQDEGGYIMSNRNLDLQQNPSDFGFRMFKKEDILTMACEEDNITVFIIKAGDQCIAIKPLKKNKKTVIYKWKFWPETYVIKTPSENPMKGITD